MTEQDFWTDRVTEATMSKLSYAGAGTSIGASLTFTDIGILVGICTAIATFALNAWFQWDRRRREIKEHEARLKKLDDEE